MMTRREAPLPLKETHFALLAIMEIPPQQKECVRLGHLKWRRGSSPPPISSQGLAYKWAAAYTTTTKISSACFQLADEVEITYLLSQQ